MPRRMFSGNAKATTLNGAINSTTSAIILADATGYPSGASGNFWIVVDRGTATEEKILCSATAGNTVTAVDRTNSANRDGTSNTSHANAAPVEHCWTANDADDDNAHVYTTSRDDHTQYILTAGTRAFTGVTSIANSTPTNSGVGDAAAIGSGNVLARSTHVHGREAFATPVATGLANAAGAATTVPRSDHVHIGPGTLASGYAQVTANQTINSATPVDLTSLTVTVTVVAGRRIKITGCVALGGNTAGDEYNCSIREGGTTLQQAADSQVVAADARLYTLTPICVLTPSAGAHTYKLSAFRSRGSGDVFLVASATLPAFILVEDIGT